MMNRLKGIRITPPTTYNKAVRIPSSSACRANSGIGCTSATTRSASTPNRQATHANTTQATMRARWWNSLARMLRSCESNSPDNSRNQSMARVNRLPSADSSSLSDHSASLIAPYTRPSHVVGSPNSGTV